MTSIPKISATALNCGSFPPPVLKPSLQRAKPFSKNVSEAVASSSCLGLSKLIKNEKGFHRRSIIHKNHKLIQKSNAKCSREFSGNYIFQVEIIRYQ